MSQGVCSVVSVRKHWNLTAYRILMLLLSIIYQVDTARCIVILYTIVDYSHI